VLEAARWLCSHRAVAFAALVRYRTDPATPTRSLVCIDRTPGWTIPVVDGQLVLTGLNDRE
jgi:hypothetical protein